MLTNLVRMSCMIFTRFFPHIFCKQHLVGWTAATYIVLFWGGPEGEFQSGSVTATGATGDTACQCRGRRGMCWKIQSHILEVSMQGSVSWIPVVCTWSFYIRNSKFMKLNIIWQYLSRIQFPINCYLLVIYIQNIRINK